MICKYFSLSAVCAIFTCLSFAQTTNKPGTYKFLIDLVNVQEDKVKVELTTPVIASNTITFHIPKIVPGTYSDDDYGRYIEQFKAFDKKGDALTVTKSDANSWV